MAPSYERPQPAYLNVKQPGKYRVIAIPVPKPKEYPAIGLVGEVKFTSSWNGACLNIMGKDFMVPFDCIQSVEETTIEDAELVAVMLDNPYGVYKLLRGLWRMTKNPVIRNFMERGELPEDGTAMVARNKKTSVDYNQQWDEAEEARQACEDRLAEEAALSGAFSTEFCS